MLKVSIENQNVNENFGKVQGMVWWGYGVLPYLLMRDNGITILGNVFIKYS